MLKVLFTLCLAAVLLYSCNKQDNLHIQHQQLKMLWYDEFDALDASLNKQYDLLRAGELRPLDFSLQIQSLEYANSGIDPHFKRYIAAKPNSKWPHLLYGLYLIKQAGDARGSLNYAETPKVRIDKMHALLAEAMPHLKTAREKAAPIDLYAGGWITMHMLGTDTGSSPKELRALVQEAMARDGYTRHAPYAYMQMLYPQWGGSEVEMQAFIDDVKGGDPELGRSLKADLYWARGIRYRSRGDRQQAIAAYKNAVSMYPHSSALNALGNAYMDAGQCNDAAELFERNLEENDPWDLYTIELSMQAHRCAGNRWKANRASAKRSELTSRYRRGK